ETRNRFSREEFSRMKPGSIFINTSRGGVHDEEALIDALQRNVIWGAGLDVTNPEPMHPDNPLLTMENVAILPHIGSGTEETRSDMARTAAENLISFFRNGTVPHCVNPDVLNR
ncbi:MAG: NAD(P)-dependent oxidoreductase, partial [Bacteroidota bacterium]